MDIDWITGLNEPDPFDTVASWEQYIAELKALPDSAMNKLLNIQSAEEMLAQKIRTGDR